MNYYYNPILGLQYQYTGDLFLIDVNCLPQDFNIENLLNLLQETGIQLSNSYNSDIQVIGRITEEYLG